MQWTSAAGAGFSGAEPWLPLGDPRRNVEDDAADPDSLLSLYTRLIRLRRRSRALSSGSYTAIGATGEGIFAYLREGEGERYLVTVNFLDRAGEIHLPGESPSGRIVCSTSLGRESADATARLQLGPNEACILRLN